MYGVGFGYGAIGATTKRSSGVAIDADAQAFFTASGVTDATQKNAVNQLVLDLKSNALWTKIKALYPIVGGNATAHSYNLINTSLYQLTYATGMTHTSNGMTSNGSSGYANTNFANNLTSQNSVSLGVYMKGASFGNGLFGSIGSSSRSYIYAANVQIYITANNDTNAVVDSSRGFWGVTRTNSTTRTVVNQTTTFTNSVTSATPSTYNQFINAVNLNGSAFGYSPSGVNVSFAFQGDGLSISELETLRTLVINYQTTLGRN